MSKQLIRKYRHQLLAALILLPGSSLALESDKLAPAYYEAGNTKMRNEGDTRIVELSENVRVTQGTLEILGDQATIEINRITNVFSKITVHGNPAHYQQQTNEDGGVVIGTSKTLIFYTDDINGGSIVELLGEASIETPDSTMSCSSIIYNVDEELIDSPGPCTGVFGSANN